MSLLNIYALIWIVEFAMLNLLFLVIREANIIITISVWFWIFIFPIILLIVLFNIIRYFYLYNKN